MSWPSWLVVLFASVLLIPGAYSIDIGFSAENGGESTGLSSSYDVDTGVSVSEESEASFDQPAIENTRSVSGTGDINAAQTYSGSKGYGGESRLEASDAITTLSSTACLTPGTLESSLMATISGKGVDLSQLFAGGSGYSANSRVQANYANTALKSKVSLTPEALFLGQGAYINGAGGEVSLNGVQGSESARQSASFEGGWISSGQGMIAGNSIYTAQDTSLVANTGTVISRASIDGNQAETGLYQMVNPALITEQAASAADGIARTELFTLAIADMGYARSSADGGNGAHADVGLKLKDGFAVESQGSMAGEGLVPTATLNSLMAGGVEFDAHSSYPSPGFGYLSYSDAIGPGDKIPVAEGKEWWGFIPKINWQWDPNEKEKLRQQIGPAFPMELVMTYEKVERLNENGIEATVTTHLDGSKTIEINGHTIPFLPEQFNTVIDAIGAEGCIQADVGDAKKAIVLEPMYTAFSKVASDPSQSDPPFETEGDAAYRYLLDSGYATWRYMDTAATREHYQELDDYNAALIVSHMNSYAIALSTPSDNPDEGKMVYAWELDDWYTNPSPDSLVLLSGCESAGPGFLGIHDLSLFGAVDEASTVAGFPGSVYTGWAGDSVSELFKYMNEHPGSTITQAQSYIWNDFRPNWEARHFSGSGVQNLEIAGDGNWKLRS